MARYFAIFFMGRFYNHSTAWVYTGRAVYNSDSQFEQNSPVGKLILSVWRLNMGKVMGETILAFVWFHIDIQI